MKKIDEAIAKITKEAMEIGHPYAIFLEEHLTEICMTDRVAEKLLAEDRSLKTHVNDVVAEMRKAAEKNRKGNTGGVGLSDEEAFRRVEGYYRIQPEDKKRIAAAPGVIDLSDFLEV